MNLHSTTSSTAGRSVVSDALADVVDAALVEIEGQVLLSQGRCVDFLLDLFNATPVATTRHLIGERLTDIRHLRMVEADEVRADLHAVVAIAAAEAAIEGALIAAAEAALDLPFGGRVPPPNTQIATATV